MNYGKLTAGTTKTAIDTAKPSEMGEIITYLSRMGDVLHDVAEGSEVVLSTEAVNSVVYGNQANALLPQQFHDLSDLEVIPADPAHVLYIDAVHVPGFNFLQHCHESGTVEPTAAHPVIGEMA